MQSISTLRNSASRYATRAPRALAAGTIRHSSTGHDNDPDVLETEKAKNLAGKPHQTSAPMDHAPGWNELLASSSEASVKADRDSTSPAELASRTVEHVQARYSDHQGSSENDSVKGPLSGAGKDPILVKKTIKEETTEAFKAPTDSEDVVKADRGEA